MKTPFLDEVAAVYGPILGLIFLMSSANTVYYVFFLKIFWPGLHGVVLRSFGAGRARPLRR
ncbi:hypothetical protein [Ottowia massiliensis]|jgi:hypothetical protein|uniref:hypothetical protein n=1 Tax=Ottowia massiliensis TaxID=2045302 RepID=UPI0011AECED0|nr:hypothetical protein [Ottowia massiliensis]